MRAWRKTLGQASIYQKFLWTSLIIGILPLVILAVISFLVSSRATLKRSSDIIATNLQMASAMIDIQTESVERLARSVLDNETICRALKAAPKNGARLYPSAETNLAVTAQLKRICTGNGDIASIYLFNWNGFCYRYRRGGSASALSIGLQDYLQSAWYVRTIRAQGYECYFLEDVLTPATETRGGVYSVSVTKLLRDLKTGEAYGVLVLNVNQSAYHNILAGALREDDACYFLADKRGQRANYLKISAGDEAVMGDAIRGYLSGVGLRNNYLTTEAENHRTGWTVVHIVEMKSFLSDNTAIFYVTFFALGLLAALAIFFSVLSARTITRPLTRLSTAIGEVAQGKALVDPSFGDDEVGRIGNQFVRLIRSNRQLNQKLFEVTLLEREAELNALQAQINPHFLYNTLSSIYWLCKLGRSEDAADMAVSLSDIFKMALNKDCNEIAVEQEIQHVKRYLSIQNVRYNGRISVCWSVDEALLTHRILKLILQPLVENAIYHGLEPKAAGDWTLRIDGHFDGPDMVFSVEDNGVGMEVAQAMAAGYGLKNVMARIRLKYGARYGCDFDSQPGRGTRVTVRIPRTKEA